MITFSRIIPIASFAAVALALPLSAQTARSSGAEFLLLLGTASHASGAMAIFDGTRVEFQGLMHAGDRLGEWTLASIGHESVRLRSVAGEVELRVGQQLRREVAGQWTAAELPRVTPSDPIAPAPAAKVSTAPVVSQPLLPEMPQVPEFSDKQLLKLEKKLTEPSKAEKMEIKLESDGGKEFKKAGKEMRRSD